MERKKLYAYRHSHTPIIDIAPESTFHHMGSLACGCKPMFAVVDDHLIIRHNELKHDWIVPEDGPEQYMRRKGLSPADMFYKDDCIESHGWNAPYAESHHTGVPIRVCSQCNRVESPDHSDGECVGDGNHGAYPSFVDSFCDVVGEMEFIGYEDECTPYPPHCEQPPGR